MFPKFDKVISRAEALIEKLDALLPAPTPPNDWRAIAYVWRKQPATMFSAARGALVPVTRPHKIALTDLHDIDDQKQRLVENTTQFVRGKPANNVLLTGARGTGKSSLIKAVLHRFAAKGLRLIEVDRADLIDLPLIADIVAARRERFIIFADDLSFEANDPAYKALKSVLDGGVSARDLLVVEDKVRLDGSADREHVLGERNAQPCVGSLQDEKRGNLLVQPSLLKPVQVVPSGLSFQRAEGFFRIACFHSLGCFATLFALPRG